MRDANCDVMKLEFFNYSPNFARSSICDPISLKIGDVMKEKNSDVMELEFFNYFYYSRLEVPNRVFEYTTKT